MIEQVFRGIVIAWVFVTLLVPPASGAATPTGEQPGAGRVGALRASCAAANSHSSHLGNLVLQVLSMPSPPAWREDRARVALAMVVVSVAPGLGSAVGDTWAYSFERLQIQSCQRLLS